MTQNVKLKRWKKGPILRRSKRLAGIPADGSPVTDGTHKVTGDTTVRTIHLDEGVGIVDASEPKAVNFIFNTSINSDPGEPKSIFEALNGADKKWWKLSGIAEVNNFLSRGAWKFVLKSSVPDRKLVGTKVVFKKKDEGDMVMLEFLTKDQQEKFYISLMRSMYRNVDSAL